MKSGEYLVSFPEKFSVILEPLYQRLLRAGFDNDLIQTLKPKAQVLVALEDEIEQLRVLFEKYPELEISQDDIDELNHVFSLIKQTNKELSGVSFTSDFNATINQFTNIINAQFGGDITEAGYYKSKTKVLKSWIERIRLKYQVIASLIVLDQTDRRSTLKEAVDLADKWINNQEKLTNLIQNKRKLDFLSKADEHSSDERRVWILSALLAASCVGGIFFWALTSVELTAPKSVLLAVLSSTLLYLVWFCLNQYNVHIQLYEAYKFRAIIIEMSSVLTSTYQNHEAEVFKKSMDVIYSEPAFNIFSGGKNGIDSDMKKFFMDIVKSRVIGKE